MSAESKSSRTLSPTRSTIAWKSSEPATPLLDAVDDRELVRALLEHRVRRRELRGALGHLRFEALAPIARCRARPLPARPACSAGRGRRRESGRTRRRCPRTGSRASAAARSAARRRSSAARARRRSPARGAGSSHACAAHRRAAARSRDSIAAASSPAGSSDPAICGPSGVSSTSSTRSAPLNSVTSSTRNSCRSAALRNSFIRMPVSTRRSNGARRSASPARCAVRRFADRRRSPRMLDPCAHDRAVRVDLVEVAATQALVAQRTDAFEQQRVRVLQRALRFLGCAVRGQRLVAPPPHVSGREAGADCGDVPVQRASRRRGAKPRAPPPRHRRAGAPCTDRSEPVSGSWSPASALHGAARSRGTALLPRRRAPDWRPCRRTSPCPAPRIRRCSRPAATGSPRARRGTCAPFRRCPRSRRCRPRSSAHSPRWRSRGGAAVFPLIGAPCGSSAGTGPARDRQARGCCRSPLVPRRCRTPGSTRATDAGRAGASRGRCAGASGC